MIRFIATVIEVVGFLILSIPVLLIEIIIGKINPKTKDISSLRIVQHIFRTCLRISGSKITYIGEENVPQDTPVLYIGNHRSYFDILLTYTRCKRCTGYIAKDGMAKIPLLSNWMRNLHCLFLNRDNLKEGLKVILTAIDEVKHGISICIFPEGTRNKNEDMLELLPFHEGSFKIATRTNCPIIPIAITNSSKIFEDHFPFIRPADITVEYGKPILLDNLTKDEKKFLGVYTRNIIIEMLRANQSS